MMLPSVSRKAEALSVVGIISPDALLGWSRREDDGAFARATTVEFGRDRLWEVTAGAVLPWGRWSLRPAVTYLRNHSNIELYSFRRTEASLMVRCEFP